MGELLPDGTIGSYQGYCPNCKKVIRTNIQGNEIGSHKCSITGMIKLFYSPPKWKAFIAPEYIDDMYHVENCLNDKAYAEAKANALEVGNPQMIRHCFFEGLFKKLGTMPEKFKMEEGKEYDWIGSAVIKDGKYILSI